MRKAPPVVLTDEERETLARWSRGRSTPARLVLRAQIVLMAADGRESKDIAAALRVTPNTAGLWRGRFAASRLAGIAKDAPRGGRTARQRERWATRIVEATTTATPAGATHWSNRTLAAHLGCDRNMVQRVWRASGLKPHLTDTFKVSNDPRFAERVVDVVGLYLDPPEHALVLSVDEKSQIQALDRTQPGLPLKRGRCGTRTHDYVRHGTTTLFAALSTLDGNVITACMPRHRHQEWIRFLRQIDRQTPAGLDLHLIVDNYATHKHPKVKAWLTKHPRFRVHFTPTASSWLNLVERWFRDLAEKRLRRGVFTSVGRLIEAIAEYVERHNRDPKAFVWTAKADKILEKVRRARAVLDNLPTT
jgi:transposase/DNA-binding CsgD family transcriptional regulator